MLKKECPVESGSRNWIYWMPFVYIMEMVYQIKINIKELKRNLTIHNYETRQRFDLQTRYCRTDIFKKSITNLGTKLYNKLPNQIKVLENLKLFKKEIKAFLLHHTFYSVDKNLSHGWNTYFKNLIYETRNVID